jgi:uncharacterized repeat protein (TIGR03803 family)
MATFTPTATELYPEAGLVLSGNTLYGTAADGGSGGWGTVFAVNTDGTGFRNLHSFRSTVTGDGLHPAAGLILSGDTLYGTTAYGGSWSNGTVFSLNTDGTGLTNLHSFTGFPVLPYVTNSEGANPLAGLLLSGNTLYGTAANGGNGDGTIFKVNTDTTGFTILYSFAAGANNSSGRFTNSDGAAPEAGLILSGRTLYGTTATGGSSGWGKVFAINTNGTGFTNLYSFSGGIDGGSPAAGLILSGRTLYGTTAGGGGGNGTVFAVNTNGTGFTNLYSFTALSSPYLNGTNSDGAEPVAGLVLSGKTLYGTAVRGGRFGNGTVFSLSTDGTGFTNLYSFTGVSNSGTNSDGAYPEAGLVLSGNTLYGTTQQGGNGTVFSISFTPQLSITQAGTKVILTWPTNYAGFDYTGYTLQSTTNLNSPVWATNSTAPVVVNGQNTVTNPISGLQQFFRLSQ